MNYENAIELGQKSADVNLIETLKGTEKFSNMKTDDAAVYGAFGCFEDKASYELYEEDQTNEKLRSHKKIFDETAGRGHGSVTDQSSFVWSMKNVTRATTLFLCGPQYMSHLQQSLRRAHADKGFHVPDILHQSVYKNAIDIQVEAFNLYEKMIEKSIPGEDARYILPLNTYTNIQTMSDTREFFHLYHMTFDKNSNIPSATKYTIDKMYDLAQEIAPDMLELRSNSMEVKAWYPSVQLFSKQNLIVDSLSEKYYDNNVCLHNYSGLNIGSTLNRILQAEFKENCIKGEESALSVLKHFHFTFFVRFSLAAFHQAIRQRTWDISCQSIYNAIQAPIFIVPPSIESSEFVNDYCDLQIAMVNIAKDIILNGVSEEEAIGIVPHSLCVGSLLHINGWNALHSIAKRTCVKAQWDIRKLAVKIAGEILSADPLFMDIVGPQCDVYGHCPEAKPCGRIGQITVKRSDK
jgi:thymidylate synthase (FAD)